MSRQSDVVVVLGKTMEVRHLSLIAWGFVARSSSRFVGSLLMSLFFWIFVINNGTTFYFAMEVPSTTSPCDCC
jgi:hypothetical protein